MQTTCQKCIRVLAIPKMIYECSEEIDSVIRGYILCLTEYTGDIRRKQLLEKECDDGSRVEITLSSRYKINSEPKLTIQVTASEETIPCGSDTYREHAIGCQQRLMRHVVRLVSKEPCTCIFVAEGPRRANVVMFCKDRWVLAHTTWMPHIPHENVEESYGLILHREKWFRRQADMLDCLCREGVGIRAFLLDPLEVRA